MASFPVHLTVSSSLGFIYGGLVANHLSIEPATAALAGGVTAIGGVLPDLDSDTGIPVREMFSLAGVLVPIMLMPRMIQAELTQEQILVVFGFLYVFIRYVLSKIFKRISVHRGMYHSIPAMLIAGMAVFIAYHSTLKIKLVLAIGVMIGFLSHLVLDEIYSVNFEGVTIKLKSSAGSAVKFWSPSFFGSAICYIILGAMTFFTYREVVGMTHERIEIHLPSGPSFPK